MGFQRSNKLPIKKSGPSFWRVNLFILGCLCIFSLIGYRLFNLSFIKHESFLRSAESQYKMPTVIANRGNIYFSDYETGGRKIAATNRSISYLYANNKIIEKNPATLAAELAIILQQDISKLEKKFSQKDKSYIIIADDLILEQVAQLKALKIKGLTVASRLERFYPLGATASKLLGFVGFNGNDRAGQYGIESYYNSILAGKKEKFAVFDVFNLNFFKSKNDQKSEKTSVNEGSDLVLSIDKNIQIFAETKLNEVLKKWSSNSGQIIIQDPKTGEIMAMAASPSFNPNTYAEYDFKDFINPANQEVYEPGSSFKPITMSGAIDKGVLTPETTYQDTGEVNFSGYTIKNFDEKDHGLQTMRQVLERSLNTGVIFVQNKLGDDAFLNYVVGFGFGQKTEVDLGGEIQGNISNLYTGRKINFATASFGQGIAVTPIQLLNSYSAIANGGKLMRPHLAKSIIAKDGSITDIKPEIIGSPISEKTSRQIQSMLVDVVDKGFDKARIGGYDVAGKTGTAQIPSTEGGYLANDQFIHNFVGFAPAYNARFTILIKMDRPKGIKFAADSLSPVFGELARFLIRYFNIPPTR